MSDYSGHPRQVFRWAAICCTVLLCVGPSASPGRERGADGVFEERSSRHFLLLQDVDIDHYGGFGGSRKFERDILRVLDQAYDEVRDQLDIAPPGRIRVIVYDAGVYDARFGGLFGFRSAGFFDGVVHVRGATTIDDRLVRTLHHEYVHAALASIAPRSALPGWLNEGLAEYFERPFGHRRLTRGELLYLQQAIAQDRWIPLPQLARPSFSGLGGEQASLAYLESFALVEMLAREHGMHRLTRLCHEAPGGLERALRRTHRLDVEELDERLLGELR